MASGQNATDLLNKIKAEGLVLAIKFAEGDIDEEEFKESMLILADAAKHLEEQPPVADSEPEPISVEPEVPHWETGEFESRPAQIKEDEAKIPAWQSRAPLDVRLAMAVRSFCDTYLNAR